MKVTHIVPRFAPQFDGLGDYARLLGDHLLRDHGVISRYVVGDPEWASEGADKAPAVSYEISPVPRQHSAALLALIEDESIVILHYVGYGYQSRGVPFWINRALGQWKSLSGSRHLFVVFHELWASGPPWKSECYLGFIQRGLVAELHRMADASLTSGALGLRRLNAIRNHRTIIHPVPSGISSESVPTRNWHRAGEPVTLALFGLPSQRELSARAHQNLVAQLDGEGLLAGVNVIGKSARGGARPSRDVATLGEVIDLEKVHLVADASSELAGRTLSESDLLLSFYPSRWLGKSGSVMAGLANGVVPVLQEGRDLEALGLREEVFVCGRERASYQQLLQGIRDGGIARAGKAARRWYVANSDWPVLAEKVMATLKSFQEAGAEALKDGH